MMRVRSAGLAAISGANRIAIPDAAVATRSGGANGCATPSRTSSRTNRVILFSSRSRMPCHSARTCSSVRA